MTTRKSIYLILTICLSMVFIFIFPGEGLAATTIYVGNSDADFICDGKDDHVQINAALKKAAGLNGATVYLKGPFTYNICETMYIGDNTTLTGDKSAVLKLGSGLKWAKQQPMIQQMNVKGGNKNITICGFEMDGNRSGNSHHTYGEGYFNFMYFANCSNIDVHDMYLHDNLGDGLRANHGGNVKFYNNKIERLGHDGLFCIKMTHIEAYNNRITTSTNSGLRIYDSNFVRFHDNIIDAKGNGGPGIQIESQGSMPVNDVQIYNNTLQNTYGPGIWLIRITKNHGNDFSYACNVRIAANLFINCGTNRGIEWVGGIVADGWDQTVIEDNLFDGCYGAAIVHRHPKANKDGQPIPPPSTGYTTIVRDNTIKNTRSHSTAGSGIGIYNYVSTNIFKVSNNTMENNPGGDTVGKNIVNDPVSSIAKFKASPLPKYTGPVNYGGYTVPTYVLPKATLNPFSFIGSNLKKQSNITDAANSISPKTNYKVTPNYANLTLSASAYKPANISSLENVNAVKSKIGNLSTGNSSNNGSSSQPALYSSFAGSIKKPIKINYKGGG